MQILVACEESQAVTIALRKLGHEAYSCDLIPCSGGHPEWHIQQDVLPLLNGYCFFKTCDAPHIMCWGGGTCSLLSRPAPIFPMPGPAAYILKRGSLTWSATKKGWRARPFYEVSDRRVSQNCR